MREEHRTITALFADLAGSTALSERLHEEEVKLFVGEAVGRIAVEIERLGRYVKDFAGDGVLAFFGAPTSYEDDAERASDDIEASFRLALEIAQRQVAKALELRAAVELARWWSTHGAGLQKAEGQRLLENVYSWFNEGYETPDLKAARQLLDELS